MTNPWNPPADPAQGYEGLIGRTLAQSRPWWRPRHRAPAHAPNVVVVLLDDLGFSDLGCFGGEILTPHIDAIAAQGLRFTGYTTVPMCTPARAALLTGKNPHAVGCGWLTHNHPGYPGYQAGEISLDAPTMAELLRAQGYATYAVGKWHNTPDYQVGSATERASWPLQRGFDRFYGFMGAETNSFSPGHLVQDNAFLSPDAYAADYYSTRDWTDRSIEYLRAHQGSAPDKPFFLYLAHNAPHVPLQAPPENVARYAGVYEQGWDAIRRQRFERQRLMGIAEPHWRLAETHPGVTPWDDMAPQDRPLMARYMQLYAAMVDSVDQQLGRLVAELQALGVWDQTLLILTSDNGASSIGGPEGAANIQDKRMPQGEDPARARQLFQSGLLGTVDSAPAYPVAWGNCSNTPFRFYKRTPMNGGIRVPLIVRDPQRIADPGALRRQWVHVTDTVPTLLDLLGLNYPAQFLGQATRGLDGVSYLKMLSDPQAVAARKTQHYELEGNRGFIDYPWKIVSLQPLGGLMDLDRWLLFDLEADPTEAVDLAARHPQVLARLVEAFERDALANRVYPIDNRDLRRVLALSPHSEEAAAAPRHFYPGVGTVPPHSVSVLVADRHYRIECEFDWQPGVQGVLFALGDSAGGLAAFVMGDRLRVVHAARRDVTHELSLSMAPGPQALTIEHQALGARKGQATVALNGQAAEQPLDMSPTFLRLSGEGLDVGLDRRRKVAVDYQHLGTFAYGGRIVRLSIHPGAQAPGSVANRPEALAQLD